MNNILVTGATGHLGAIVIANLLKKVPASQIFALVRDENKAADLKAKGVNIRVGDYTNSATLEKAFAGIDKLLLISSSDFNDRLGQHKNAVNAAKAAGVKHILYTGVTLKDLNASPLKHFLAEHFATEDYIKASGLTYTFLQNNLYAEVIPMFVGPAVLETGVFFAAGDGKVAFANRTDLGEATANILTSAGHENKTYQLTGKVAYSFAEVAAILSDLSGKTVNYISPEREAFKAALAQFGLPEHIIAMSDGFAAGMKNNDFDVTGNTLESFLGREETSLKAYLKAALGL